MLVISVQKFQIALILCAPWGAYIIHHCSWFILIFVPIYCWLHILFSFHLTPSHPSPFLGTYRFGSNDDEKGDSGGPGDLTTLGTSDKYRISFSSGATVLPGCSDSFKDCRISVLHQAALLGGGGTEELQPQAWKEFFFFFFNQKAITTEPCRIFFMLTRGVG